MKRFIFLSTICLSLLFLTPFLADAETISHQKMFSIRRSLNDNELVYEARMTSEGFNESDPVNIYWVMNTKSGAIEPLTNLEKKRAYGIKLEMASKEKVVFSLKALPNKTITLSRKSGEVVTTLLINGEEAFVESIFIKTVPGGPIPSIEFVEVKGKSTTTGKNLTEKISSKKKE